MKPGLFRLAAVVSAVLSFFQATALRGGVVESVEVFLDEHRMPFGYDATAHSCIFIGKAKGDLHAPLDSPEFLAARNKLIRVAEREAKAEIMRVVSSSLSATRARTLEAGGDAFSAASGSLVSLFANTPLRGCETLCVREEKATDSIQVAVAMKWSSAMEREAASALEGSVDFSGISTEDEWQKWAERFDFVHAGCSASFVGSDGIRRWVGIGVADIEGKRGASAVAAMQVARLKATAELAYALFGETEAQAVARRYLTENASGASPARAVTSQEFESQIIQTVKSKRLLAAEVYTTTVVHPLTGRELFVSVVGIEPQKLAEMRILGNGTTSPSASPPARPDHTVRPPSNRPDHSWRPPTDRPDHSPRPPSARPYHPVRGQGAFPEEEMDF